MLAMNCITLLSGDACWHCNTITVDLLVLVMIQIGPIRAKKQNSYNFKQTPVIAMVCSCCAYNCIAMDFKSKAKSTLRDYIRDEILPIFAECVAIESTFLISTIF